VPKLATFASILVGLACSTARPPGLDAGSDAGERVEVSRPDAGTLLDAGASRNDAGSRDSGQVAHDAGWDGGVHDSGAVDAGPLPCSPSEREVRLDGGNICFSSRDVTQLVLDAFPGAMILPRVANRPSATELPLFFSSEEDGGIYLVYVLAAEYRQGTLAFLEPLVPSIRSSAHASAAGTMCRSSPVTGEPTLYFRDGGFVSMQGFNGDCKYIANNYWLGVGPTGYGIARMGESQWQRVPALVGDVVGLDDHGVVVVMRSLPNNLSEVVGLLRDGGSKPLTASGGPALMAPDAVATTGFVAGSIDYYPYYDYVVWRLDGPTTEPIVRVRGRLNGSVQAVSGQGDICGRFIGGRRGYIIPIGYSEFIDPDQEFPELNNLECAGVLGDGAFLYTAYQGDPRRFVIATVRVGPPH